MTTAYKAGKLIFIFLALFAVSAAAEAQTETPTKCDPIEITVIARNASGNYISDISFEIFTQISDPDGKPRPGTKVASGKISNTSGFGKVTFTDKDHTDYAIKMWHKNSSVGAFYFYNDLMADCGQKVSVTEQLSSISFTLRNTEEELIKNYSFNVYAQQYDKDNKPIRQKGSLVAALNSSEQGGSTIYVTGRSNSFDDAGGSYIFEANGRSGGVYTKYDIEVGDGSNTDLNYIFSDMEILLLDAAGIAYPSGSKIEIFKQIADSNDQKTLGVHIRDIDTDDNGKAVLEYPADIFAAKVKGANNIYEYFWDLAITDQQRETYTLKSGEATEPGNEICQKSSALTVAITDLAGNFLPGISYSLHEQKNDAKGTPMPGGKIADGAVDPYGKALISFHPDPRKKYALKIYDKNPSVGEFWYFNELQFACGDNREIAKSLPAVKIILRDADGNLKKNQTFSIYTQKYDADNKPIKTKKELVTSLLSTSDEGAAKIYLSPDHPYDSAKKGTYVFVAAGKNGLEYSEYNINVANDQDVNFDYIFSEAILVFKTPNGFPLADKKFNFHEQKTVNGQKIPGKSLSSSKLDKNGSAKIEYPPGTYAAVIKDDLNQDYFFSDIRIAEKKRTNTAITANLTHIAVKQNDKTNTKKQINIYALKDNGQGSYKIGGKIKSSNLSTAGDIDLVMAPNPYLVTVTSNKKEYGKTIYTENKAQSLTIDPIPSNEINPNKIFTIKRPAAQAPLKNRLEGYILLQVEGSGQAWYVVPSEGKRYYLKNGDSAYALMRRFGLGIANDNLKKIPIGLNARSSESDADSDGVSDSLEAAIGTKKNSRDSDNDGFEDGLEIKNGYNPSGGGKMKNDQAMVAKVKGQILLQVQSNGEAWYVNPRDGRRYFLKNGPGAFEIMKYLGLGVSNADLEKIEIGG